MSTNTKATPPGAKATKTIVKAAAPKLTEEQIKAKRSERRKIRRLAKHKEAGTIPLELRPRIPGDTGRLVPREGTARLFCYNLQVKHGMPEVAELVELMKKHSKGTEFEGRENRWFNRRAWRNVRYFGSKTVKAAPIGTDRGSKDD